MRVSFSDELIVVLQNIAEDIAVYLTSRHGVLVTPEEVRDTILEGLGGGNSDNECLDLMEIVAILLIPTILKASREQDESLKQKIVKPPPALLETTLSMILEDVRVMILLHQTTIL